MAILKCVDCCCYWKDDGDAYECCHWEGRGPDDIPPCEEEEYPDYGYECDYDYDY